MAKPPAWKDLLNQEQPLLLPCAHDALSARLIERAGFTAYSVGGFALVGSRYAMPDIGLAAYAEISAGIRDIMAATRLPVLVDGDTGYGDVKNVAHTIEGYEAMGASAIFLEDQVAPKRCGHTEGKAVVSRDEALMRIRAAVDARNAGADILIMARTDARACVSLDEAIARCRAFRELGADITFLEAPLDEAEMRRYCTDVDGPKMANLIEGGKTPLLPHATLEAIGYKIAVYPLTMLNVSIRAMRRALQELHSGRPASSAMDFEQLKSAVGFPAYYEEEARYRI